VCQDIIGSNCVFYSGGSLECIDVSYGDTITSVIGSINTAICNLQSSNSCSVKVSADDSCCDYLGNPGGIVGSQGNKIRSTSLSIDIVGDSCQYLQIEERCWIWRSVLSGIGDGRFKGKWGNLGLGFQTAQYSNIKECVVKLRGTVINSLYTPSDTIIFVLPVGLRPLFDRRFSVNISNGISSAPSSVGFIYVRANGNVELQYTQTTSGATVVSLDNVSFEIN